MVVSFILGALLGQASVLLFEKYLEHKAQLKVLAVKAEVAKLEAEGVAVSTEVKAVLARVKAAL